MASSSAAARRTIRGARSLLRHYSAIAAPQASSSSAASSSSWKPPIAAGTEPAYDEALKYISTHQARLKQQIPALQKEVDQAQEGSEERLIAQAKLDSFLIASQVNDPEVRWRFENGIDAHLSNPVFSHLREKTWRDQRLPRLIERIRLMHVLPDAISHITPVVDLRVAFGEGDGFHDHGGEAGDVLPGCFVDPRKTVEAPTITATPSHKDERLYTLALVDVDAPYEDKQRLGSYAHWLVHNIPFSLTKTRADMQAGEEVLPYIPPHPANGTKYHRYSMVLLAQSQTISNTEKPEREHFSLHTYAKEKGLIPAGIHFWRAIWSKEAKTTISDIYTNTLHKPEPTFR